MMLKKSLEDLVGGDFNARWQAAKVLKAYGDEAHGQLLELAESSFHDPDLQGFIVGILSAHPTPEILLTLVEMLKKSSDDELKETIVLALGKQGSSQIEALLSLSEQPELQSAVLRALVQINHPNTVEGLLKFSTHDNSAFRNLAFDALGQFHGDRITQVLRQGLKDPASDVRVACVKALGLRRASEVDADLVTQVSGLLYDINPRVCDLAARTLGRFNHPLALDYLWRRLVEQSAPTSLTQSLIQALGWSSHSRGVTYLLKLLSLVSTETVDNGLGLPWSAPLMNDLIQTIANLESSEHIGEICQRLTDLLSVQREPFDQIQVKQRLIMAVAHLRQDASIPALIKMLAVDDERIRFHVIAALRQINPALSHDKVMFHYQDSDLDPKLKDGLAIALQEW